MELTLQRSDATPLSTPGVLTGLLVPVLQTLEPPPAPDPAYPDCPVCIPPGRYEVRMMLSKHFGCPVPMLQNVPDRTGVEAHYGDWVRDPKTGRWLSEGCILVGDTRLNADEILGTRDACLNHLWPQITHAQNEGIRVWLTIRPAQSG